MTFNIMIFAHRKTGITHAEFKSRYEQHMRMIAEICGDDGPSIRHTRWYLGNKGAQDTPMLLAGDAQDPCYDVVVRIEFDDEKGWERFCGKLRTDEAKKRIEDDEAGFWDSSSMKVMVVGETKEWVKP